MSFTKSILFSILVVAGAQLTTIVQHPANDTFCEGSDATLSCVVFDNGTLDTVNWFNVDTNLAVSSNINTTRNGSLVTSAITIEDVSLNDDNDTRYLCEPVRNIESHVGVIFVAVPPMFAPTITGTTQLNGTSFTVNWTITNTDYDIIVILTNLCTEEIINIAVPENIVNSNIYNVTTGLNGRDDYNVSVAAINSCGMMMSDPVTVYGPPLAPINLRFPTDDITSESFIVQWDAVVDFLAIDYIVRWYRGDNKIGMATVNGLSYTATGLTANTSYNVTVTALYCDEAGPVSNVTIRTNNEPPTLPPTPTTTTAAATATTSSVTVTPSTTSNVLEEDNDNTGIIIGVVVAVIIIIIIVVIIIVIVTYYYLKKKKDSTDSDKQGLKSPTGTGTASIKPAANIPHQTATSGEEYAVTTKVATTTKPQQPTDEYAMVDKTKKHASAAQGIHYADLQDLPASGNKPPTNQGPTSTYAMVA